MPGSSSRPPVGQRAFTLQRLDLGVEQFVVHVVERWRVVENGRSLEVAFTVDDPDSFNEPWSAIRHYRGAPIEMHAQPEEICAENNQHLFDYHIPVANKPDF